MDWLAIARKLQGEDKGALIALVQALTAVSPEVQDFFTGALWAF